MFYGKQRYLIVAICIISICTFLCSSAKATDYFYGPSSDNNYFVPFLNSGDTVTLTQHQIKELYLISNPVGIVKRAFIPYEPFGDVELSPGESVELKIGPLDFGNVETKQQCEDFSNPVISLLSG